MLAHSDKLLYLFSFAGARINRYIFNTKKTALTIIMVRVNSFKARCMGSGMVFIYYSGSYVFTSPVEGGEKIVCLAIVLRLSAVGKGLNLHIGMKEYPVWRTCMQ